jgi:membrane protease YdiL (CAAX protease family)
LNKKIYDFSNYLTIDKENIAIAYSKVLQMIIASPIMEEVILRVILFTLLLQRTRNVIFSIIFTNIGFSALHVVNMWRDTSSFYTIFQILFAFVVGNYYSTRYFITDNLVEMVSLHIINNFFASFVPITLKYEDLYPYFLIPVAFSFVFYSVLLFFDFYEIFYSVDDFDEQEKKK